MGYSYDALTAAAFYSHFRQLIGYGFPSTYTDGTVITKKQLSCLLGFGCPRLECIAQKIELHCGVLLLSPIIAAVNQLRLFRV
jgi:hypothetical protein